MNKQKQMYELMKIFKPYYDDKKLGLKPDAPKEAVEAFKKFNVLLDSIGKMPPVEENLEK